jgi:radical SAM superfamily enzyme YgiQ (UPF0313 family)
MKVLLICTNRYRNPEPVMPFGACLVAEAAERAGRRVTLLDLMFENNPIDSVLSALRREKPDVIGISVRNIDNTDMRKPVRFFEDFKSVVDTVRGETDAPVILGGAAVGVMPEALLRYSRASCAVLGDGETIFPMLLAAIERGDGWDSVPGVGWIERGEFKKSGSATHGNFNVCWTPQFHRWIDVGAYRSHLSTVPIQTKRGCPYNCVYCTYHALEGESYRLCAPESVADTVDFLSRHGYKDIEIVDNVFNSPYKHAFEICEAVAGRACGARLQSLEMIPSFIDDELLTAMRKAGFCGMGITAESASDRVLHRLRKGFTSEAIHKAAEVLRRHSIPCIWIFMFGAPGENESTVMETLHFIERGVRPHDTVFFIEGVRVYPNTELERIAREEGQLQCPPEAMLQPVFYLSTEVDRKWLSNKLKEFMATHLNCINSDSIGLPFLPLIHRYSYILGIRPPLWRYTRHLRRLLRIFIPDV